ncbi:hypothetical protein ACFP1I_01795 [Dyadobacter subterraneus]|uniref:Uncharacterized protein n=1 Tax=Dyadobacter subterraneus TaxID=2773304 RepID=A0ABR9W7Q3_9BACT|nr:hypothetical protein [Dyadobacter subterraneus]MBE9461485.1 hypothetical protein [Dyadobacter subterraneus]
MSTYLELLSNTFKSDSKQSFAFNALLEKGKQVFGNAEEFSLWLENSYSNSDQKSIDFIMDEIDRLAQGYCV